MTSSGKVLPVYVKVNSVSRPMLESMDTDLLTSSVELTDTVSSSNCKSQRVMVVIRRNSNVYTRDYCTIMDIFDKGNYVLRIFIKHVSDDLFRAT